MVLETRAVLQRPAGAQRKQAAQELQALMHRRRVRIGAEIARAVLDDAPRDEDARELLLYRDLDIRIRLVILEADIVARPVLLDEVALEDQRLDLARRHDELEIRDFRDHRTHLRRVVAAALEILPHAVLEHDGLADVDDLPRRVLHDIDTGILRQEFQLFPHDVRHDPHLPLRYGRTSSDPCDARRRAPYRPLRTASRA